MKKQFVSLTFLTFGFCGILIAQDAITEKRPTDLQLTQTQLVKLQIEYLELQKKFATCQQNVLTSTAKNLEEAILKTVEAKPGQKFDWNTNTVTSAPVATQDKKP